MFEGFPPVQYLLIIFTCWVNRQQIDVIEYLKEENRVLRGILGEQCLCFTDAQHRRLRAETQRFGAQVLNDIASIMTPGTLMAWHSKLIAMTRDHSDNAARAHRSVGLNKRPPVMILMI